MQLFPSKSDNTTDLPGTKSFYRPSSYYNNLKNIINKAQQARLVYTLILESGLLFKLFKHRNFEAYQIIRNNDKKTAWNILQTLNLTIMKKESDFEVDYNMIQNIDDRKLEDIAIKKAQLYITTHKAIDYKDLYLTAGFFFRT